jgi:hypothetical protein
VRYDRLFATDPTLRTLFEGDMIVGATNRLTAPAYWKFESISLQRRVRCELNLGKDGFADEIAAAPPGGFATLDTTICRIADPTLVARPRPAPRRINGHAVSTRASEYDQPSS